MHYDYFLVSSSSAQTMGSLSEANNHFGFDVFQELSKTKKGNIFFSPLSMASAISMVYLGVKNNTALQIEKVLHFDDITEKTKAGATNLPDTDTRNVHPHFQKLLTELNKPTDGYELSVANKIYGEKGFPFLQEYLDKVKTFYLSSAESVDFRNAAEQNRKEINAWVGTKTQEKIKDFFPQGAIKASTVLVLVNAIYFKGQWAEKFDKSNTREEPFWLNKGESKPVQMMKQKRQYKLAFLEDIQAQLIEIPYSGEDLSMFVLLPEEVDGLKKIEDTLTAKKLLQWTNSTRMGERRVTLYLPRFKVEDKFSLNDVLKSLGMVDAFNAQHADFSGMTNSRGLVVSDVLHASFVEVNEEGTEAAAATGITIIKTSLPMSEEIRCDHPFLFYIKHNSTNTILFFGRISSP
ncbi:serpin B3-like [Rhynchocyon petersi]